MYRSLSASTFRLALLSWMGLLLNLGCYTSAQVGDPNENQKRADSTDTGERKRSRDDRVRDMRDDPTEPGRAAVMAFPTGNRSTSTLLVERLSPQEVRLGDPYEYQIKVTNLTNAPLSDVIVRERVPADLQVTRNEPTPRMENGEQIFTLGDLPAKQSKMIRVS